MNVSKASIVNISSLKNVKAKNLSEPTKGAVLGAETDELSKGVVKLTSSKVKETLVKSEKHIDYPGKLGGIFKTLDGINRVFKFAGPFSEFLSFAAGIGAFFNAISGIDELVNGARSGDKHLVADGAMNLGSSILWGAMAVGTVAATPAAIGLAVITGVKLLSEAIAKRR